MRSLLTCAAISALTACASVQTPDWMPGGDARAPAHPGQFMVASADPRATEAGLKVLREGGSAVDAAVAVQAVLSLVEPQSSGVGGGAFMLHYDQDKDKLSVYDGRETAPASATAEMFLNADGEPMGFPEAYWGGRSVGVPGVMALLGKAHDAHGELPWSDLYGDAIELADNGFEVSPRLAMWLGRLESRGAADIDPVSGAYFYDEDGKARAEGDLLKNPDYAETLRLTAAEGAGAFYTGPIAEKIAKAVTGAATDPRPMTLEDLETYEAVERTPICGDYRSFDVCTMPPPTSGGVFILQALSMLEKFDIGAMEPHSPEAIHLIIEASRLAFADRQKYLGDPDFVEIPVEGLLSPDYLETRAALIDPEQALTEVEAGSPELFQTTDQSTLDRAPDDSPDRPSTSHFSIIDADGNVVSMTTTVQAAFGSLIMTGGFLLNNELTDFAFTPEQDGALVANAPAPGKRPRSSMTPTIVFDESGDVHTVIGSPGGSSIYNYVLKTLVGVLDWDLSMQEAIDLANITLPRGAPAIEENGAGVDQATLEALAAMGHEISSRELASGLNGFRITSIGFDGGADKRREGTAEASQLSE